MTPDLARVARSILAVLIVALAWVIVFKLNQLLFDGTRNSRWTHWIFIPAAVRIIAVMLLGWRGAAGLVLGAWFTLRPEDAGYLPHAIALPVSSGLAPLFAMSMWRRLTGLREDLNGLRASDIVGLALSCAVMNSALLNLVLTLTGSVQRELLQIVTVVVGDAAGIMIVLMPLALLLSLRRTRKTTS